MAGTWKDFDGLNKLSGVNKVIGEVLLKNELGGVSNGYEIVHAAAGNASDTNSGYSFGGNQLDLANNSHARDVLKDILINSGTITDGKAFYDSIASKILIKGDTMALSTDEINTINTALQSTYGKNKLNQDFANEVKDTAEHVQTIIDKIIADPNTPQGVKDALKTDEMKIFLADYHNQFRLDDNGKMMKFLLGQDVSGLNGTTINVGTDLTNSDLKTFMQNTKEYSDNPRGVNNRFDRTEQTIEDNASLLNKSNKSTTSSHGNSHVADQLNVSKVSSADNAALDSVKDELESAVGPGS